MKLNTKRTIYIGFAFLIISLFWQVYDNIIVKMLVNNFGLNQAWSGFVMALDNALALFLIPLFGMLSDKTKSRFGKRTPYIFLGVIFSAILFIGVAVVDSIQLNSINDANIPIVEVVEVEEEDLIKYKFDYTGFEEKLFETREEAENARRTVVLEQTRKNPINLIFFILILLFVLLSMSIYRSPAVSLMPDVTPKPLRSKANAIINLMGTFGGVIALIIMSFLAKDFQSYIPLFVVVATLMIILLILFMLKVNEPRFVFEMQEESKDYLNEEPEDDSNEKMSKEVRRSFLLILLSVIFWFMAYNAATTKFSIYSQYVLGMGFTMPLTTASAAAAVAFIPIGILSGKIGRKKTILIGIVILGVAFGLGFIARSNTKFLIYVTMALAGIGWATINVNSYPMVVEMSKGSNIGKYTGYYYTASMTAQVITPILSGVLMDLIDMKVLFPYSIVFCVLAFISMLNVKHGDSKPIPTSKIEAFDVD